MLKQQNNTHTQISLAPMMGYTNHCFRLMVRLLSPRVVLFTEMVTAHALIYGKVHDYHRNLLKDNVIFQVGGGDPVALSKAAKIIESLGYTGINLNVGCPSHKVMQADIGASLMLKPKQVAKCLQAMRDSVSLPISVKCRIGVDDQDSLSFLEDFVDCTQSYTQGDYYIHARKAFLRGINPKQNRSIPPLNYNRVHEIKKLFPDLNFHLNGGINNQDIFNRCIDQFDGVMMGRWFCNQPYTAALAINAYYDQPTLSRKDLVLQYLDNLDFQVSNHRWQRVTLPLQNIFKSEVGARKWRQSLSVTKNLEELKSVLQHQL